jgi:hypothetical protein
MSHKTENLERLLQHEKISTDHSGSLGKLGGSIELVRVSDLWEEQDDEIEYTVEDLLPSGSLGMLGSRPKSGKSTLARCLSVAVASGVPFLNALEVEEGDVIYLALEENRRSVVRQFKTVALKGFGMTEDEAKRVLSRISLICGQTPKDFQKRLSELVEAHKPVLIVVDTLIRLLKLQDGNSYAETSAGLEPLLHLAHDKNVTVLLLHHTKKSDSGDLLGSTGISASADVIITLGKKDGHRTMTAEGRGISLEETILNFDQSGLFYSMGVPVQEAEILAAMDKIKGFIATNDKGQGVLWKEIRSGVEGRNQTRNEALKRLEKECVLERRGKAKSKKDPLKFILVPIVPTNTQEPRFQDTENGSNSSQILVPKDDGSQEKSEFFGNQDEVIAFTEVD